MKKVKKAVIPCAGYGTRFLPITKAVPKEMLTICDKPTVHYIVEEVISAGIEEIVIVVSKGKDAIKNYFSSSEIYDNIADRTLLKSVDEIMGKVKFHFVLQEPMRGNGDAVLVTKEIIGNEPFVVCFGDDVIYNQNKSATQQLIDAFYATGKSILGVQNCEEKIACTCGCIVPGEMDGRLIQALDVIEKPPIDKLPSTYASFGRFVLTPEIFYELENAPLFKNEIYLTVALRALIKKQGAYAYDFEGTRYDIGNKLGFLKANVEYGMRNEIYGKEFSEYLNRLTNS